MLMIYTKPRCAVDGTQCFCIPSLFGTNENIGSAFLLEFTMQALQSNTFAFFTGVIPHIHKSLIGKKGANKPT